MKRNKFYGGVDMKKIDTTKLEQGLTTALGYAIKRTDNTVDNTILDRITANLNKLKEGGDVSDEDFAKALAMIVDFITDIIPGTWDDMTVDNTVNMLTGLLVNKLRKGKVG